ncbi:MAG: 4Fe-4S dicluster domain-containing protein [Methanotrichaceae archaeon]
MIVFITKNELICLLSELAEKLEIIAPITAEGETFFSTWRGELNLALDKNTLYPPTEFFMPQKETLFKYIQYSGRYTFEEPKPIPRMLLGIKPCDLKAISILDRIFGSEPQDNAYLEKRRSTVIVAFNCMRPNETCLCAKLGSGPECKDGYDLAFTELLSGYLVETGSPAGMLILQEYPQFFHQPEDSQISEKRKIMNDARKAAESREQTIEGIREAIKKADWAAIGRQCLNCGSCTFICPVCHCFNIMDVGVPDGERVRCRDSCIFSGFSRMAGGANPRRSQGERMQNWFMDKFEFLPEKIGMVGCVGCGRCGTVCLAEIDRWNLEVMR